MSFFNQLKDDLSQAFGRPRCAPAARALPRRRRGADTGSGDPAPPPCPRGGCTSRAAGAGACRELAACHSRLLRFAAAASDGPAEPLPGRWPALHNTSRPPEGRAVVCVSARVGVRVRAVRRRG